MKKLLHPSIAQYKKRYLKHDLIAALVVAAIAIPESLAFAVIVGLLPVTGLYTAVLAPIVFGLLASTRRLIVGADSATAALIASGAVLVAQSGTVGYANAVSVIGLLTAVILIIMAIARLGFLADLISRPVLVGFLAGVGVQLIITRLPTMLGVEAHGSLSQHIIQLFQQIGSINGMALTISVLVVGIILITRKTKIPGELIGLGLAMLFAFGFNVDNLGVKLVGVLPAGLPMPTYPHVNLGQVVMLLPTAISVAVVILAQSSSVIQSSANEHDEKVRLNQDLFSLGVANAVSALTRGFVVNGSPPRSLAADLAGGKSQMVNIMMGGFIGLFLLFGNQLFRWMPEAALASIVFMLGWRLIRFSELDYIWRTHRIEFFVSLIALVGTVLFGVLQGVLIAVIVSLMERISRQYHPKDDVLLRDGKLSEWAVERLGVDSRYLADSEGILVYAFDGALFFDSINYFTTRIKRAVENAEKPVKYIIVDAGAIDNIDYTAVESLKTLYRHLSSDNIRLGFAHVSPNLYHQFNEYGVTDLVGEANIYSTLSGAIKSQPNTRQTAVEKIKKLGIKQDDYVVIGGAVLEALHLRDTMDIDIVVSDEVYTRYRDKKHWKEYVQDNGKRVLVHNSYNMMRTWMGNSLKRLKRDAFVVDGVSLMNIQMLIESKRHLGRRKDLADITLLKQYLQHHPVKSEVKKNDSKIESKVH